LPTKQEYSDLSASDKKKEDWMNSKWRPMMGWMYMIVCMFDFMIAPVLWSLTQAFFHGGIATQWQPLTLQGAGLFHIAMGAVLGIAAYGRTQEKLSGANNGGLTQPVGTTYVPPGGQPGMNNNFGGSNGFNNNTSFGGSPTFGSSSTGFGSQPNSFGSTTPTPAFGSTPTGSFGSTTPTPAFGGSPPSVLPAGVGAPPPAFGAKPAGPAATAFPPL
jgi:hypothetical protein